MLAKIKRYFSEPAAPLSKPQLESASSQENLQEIIVQPAMDPLIKNTTDIGDYTVIKHEPEGETPKEIGSAFFRGKNCNFNPYLKDFSRSTFFQRFLLKGWTPPNPLIGQTTYVTAFGSCFAEHISKHLISIGYTVAKDSEPNIYISKMGEGLVNVHSIAQQFEWALENVAPPKGLWHGFKCEEYGYKEEIRIRTREAFLKTEFFILTLGLSEIWYDEVTGGIFWRAVPKAHFDETRHKFRICTFKETKDQLAKIYRLIKKHNPNAKVLFTLSPVPLAATFRPISCITANSVSKSILRAALDEFIGENSADLNKKLFYFPSYEIVSELFFSKYIDDNRHPHPAIINLIMSLFEATYCQSQISIPDIHELYLKARKENAEIALEQAGSSLRS